MLVHEYILKIKNMIFDILEKSKREKKFIGIWNYNDDEGFWSGISY